MGLNRPTVDLSQFQISHPLTSILLYLPGQIHSFAAFIDSGTDTEFIDEQLVMSLKIQYSPQFRSLLFKIT